MHWIAFSQDESTTSAILTAHQSCNILAGRSGTVTGNVTKLDLLYSMLHVHSRSSLIRGLPDWPVFLVLSEPCLKHSTLYIHVCLYVDTHRHSACTTHVYRLERSGLLPSTDLTTILYTKISMINAFLLTN